MTDSTTLLSERELQDLFVRHLDHAVFLARRVIGDADLAKDAVQEACLRCLRHPPERRTEGEVACYYLRVVYNTAVNLQRSEAARGQREARYGTSRDGAPERPEQPVEVSELARAARAHIDQLPAQMRAAICLRYEEGLTLKQTAKVLGRPTYAVGKSIRQGLDLVRSRLEAGGLACAGVAALMTALGSGGVPGAPASLTAEVSSLMSASHALSDGSAAGSGSAVPAALAEGTAKKVLAGVLLAGVLAVAAAVVNYAVTPPGEPSSSGSAMTTEDAVAALAGGGLGCEHLAFASDIDCLDGPAVEALGMGRGCMPANDGEGNLYLASEYSTCRLRCVRADGRVETIAGNDRWPGDLGLAEGPAAYLPNCFMSMQGPEVTMPAPVLTVRGLPLRGENYGCIDLSWPRKPPYRIFRNGEKGNRWWFKRLGKPGGAKPPMTVGQSARMDEVDLADARLEDGCIAWEGNVYSFDEARGEMTCLLTLADYEHKVREIIGPIRGPNTRPERILRAEDGNIFLLYYRKTFPRGHVLRIPQDTAELDYIVTDVRGQLGEGEGVRRNRDGSGLATTWTCGPADVSISGNVLFLHALDSVAVRRWMGGRVSTLCWDGQWRESPPSVRRRRRPESPVWCKQYRPGQNGVNCIYVTHPGEESGGDMRVYRLGPVDFTKPTVGLLQGDVAEEEGASEGETS